MTTQIDSKIQKLLSDSPNGAVLTSAGLKEKGFSRDLIQYYATSGWFKRIGVGAFVRVGNDVSWQGALYALQKDLKKPVHLGGLSVFEARGLAHYLSMADKKRIYLYNTSSKYLKLPNWFLSSVAQECDVHYRQGHLFEKEVGFETIQHEELSLRVSSIERAALEVLAMAPKMISIEHAYNLIMSLQTIRPKLMQELLEGCRHIIVKRLFLCLADQCNLPALEDINQKKVDLGIGNRSVGVGGRYFSKYKLTIPWNPEEEEEIHV